jgi:integrase
MKQGENYNHPEKGSLLKVEPIKEARHIRKIKNMLSERNDIRGLCLFTFGINTNLRASDLAALKVSDVAGKTPEGGFIIKDELFLKEKKTRKKRLISLNGAIKEALEMLLENRQCELDDFLFKGQRGKITPIYINLLVKKWCRETKLKGKFGSHTLRKTWGYHQRKTFGTPIVFLMQCFNHSSQKQTLDYLCIQPEEIKEVYQNEL